MVGLLCVLVFFESIFVCKKRGEEFCSRVREDLGISYFLHFSVNARKARNLPVTLPCEVKLIPWKENYSNLGVSIWISATMIDAEIQVDFDENMDGYHGCDASSSGIDTVSLIGKPSVEHLDLASSENRECKRTCNRSIEDRNITLTPSSSSAIESYVAMRLASTNLPSPIFDRRTVL